MDIIADQEKEAKKLGIQLEDENEDETVNEDEKSDDSKESQEEKPDKKNQEDETKDDDKKSDEEDSEDDKPEKPAERPSKGSLQQEAFKKREQQRLEGIVASQLGPVAEQLKGITEALAELKIAKTPEQKEDAKDNLDEELAKFGEKDRPVIKDMLDIIQKRSDAKIAGLENKIKDFAPIIQQRSEQERQQETEKIFNQEWETQGEPVLTKEYENASPQQLKEAKTLLAQLAMSADYGDTRGNKDGIAEHPAYPVDYILYKEADKFDTILRNPKKKSFESSSSLTDEGTGEQETLDTLLDGREYKSAKEAIAADKKIQRAMNSDRLIVRRGGEQVDVTD